MPSCAFPICKNTSTNKNKSSGVTFHKFPSDAAIYKIWLKKIRTARLDQEWIAHNYSYVCSDHFKSDEIYITKKGRRKIMKTAIPHQVIETPVPQKKKKPQYDPFKEYANDSNDETSLDTKHASDEDSDDSETGVLATEKAKRARFDSKIPLDYADEIYEFGKLVAEKLLCLDVNEARVAQEKIRAVLSTFGLIKEEHSCTERSTSAQPTSKSCEAQAYPAVQSKPNKQRRKVKASTSSVNKSVYIHVDTVGPSTQEYARSPGNESPDIRQSSLRKFPVVNVKDESSGAAFEYVTVPTETDSSEITLIPQIGTQDGTIVTLVETKIKIEPAEPDSQEDVMPSVVESELLVIKYEPHSDGET